MNCSGTGRQIAKRTSAAGTAQRMVTRSLALAIRIGRCIVPRSLRPRLAWIIHTVERLTVPSMQTIFIERPVSLASISPLAAAETFTGPPLLVNNALAWGGVERQIVYTLLGLGKRLQRAPGLLCLRLGTEPSYDFYKSALVSYKGLVRNVIDVDAAQAQLAAELTPQQQDQIEGCIGWLPKDVHGEIIRFLADILRLKPAVVHAWQDSISITAGYAAKIAGVPRVIVAGRNVAPIHFSYHREHMRLAYTDLAGCDHVVLLNNSAAGARSYAKWLGVPKSRFLILRNGIDVNEIARPAAAATAELRGKLGIPPEAPIVGSIFRFYSEKRPLLWVEVAREIARHRSDVHFVVFGTGPLVEQCRRRAHRFGFANRLHFPGTIANSALGMSLFDVFVLTSQFEGTPNVVLEASLLGIPVIAADSGGTAETIEPDVSGFVVGSDQPAEFARHALRALTDKSFRHRVAEKAPAFILERFGLDRMIEETSQLYEGETAPSSRGAR